jgi:hypothetical protein
MRDILKTLIESMEKGKVKNKSPTIEKWLKEKKDID